MIVWFSTVRRKRPAREGGELVMVDWPRQRVIRTVPLFPSDPDVPDDPNPRGNTRGGKGILVCPEEVWVGTYHTILVFDHSLGLRRRLSNTLFCNIHEMAWASDGAWVACTAIDAALRIDRLGNLTDVRFPREDPAWQERFQLVPLELDRQVDQRLAHLEPDRRSHTHLNAVFTRGDKVYANLSELGAIIELSPAPAVLLESPLLRGSHSPLVDEVNGWLIVARSQHRQVLFFDLESLELAWTLDLLAFPELAAILGQCPDEPFNRSLFVRGLERVGESRLLVGIAPASILELDLRERRLIRLFQYSDQVGDAVHGLAHFTRPA
ncbi:MAG: hypothetical protein V1750_04265 [Acidobacteriota bacterium]